MRNIEIGWENDGKVLVLRVRIDEEHGYTKSRKSRLIASTDGNIPIWRNGQCLTAQVNLNVFKSRRRAGELE